ncbi:MAG: apolipoprotein N-acyltransferase, partial [Treponema sp.]|nr:apolipoprotein N-acyltransferase [Treponema sp.]
MPNELFHFGSPVIAFFALVPLYLAAKKAKSYKVCAFLFAIDALATHLLSSYWLANFKDFAIFTLGASAFGTACIEAMAACLFFFPFAGTEPGLKIGGKKRCMEAFRPLHFAAVRVAYEWAKSTGFLAYPWGVLSMGAFNSKALMQSADIFGTYGISFLMAFFAACAAEFALTFNKFEFSLKNSFQNAKFDLICHAKCLVLCLILIFAYGTFKLNQKSPVQKVLNAVLVQQNMDPWASEDDLESIQKSIELSRSGIEEFKSMGKKADLVVWSEAVLRYVIPHAVGRYNYVPPTESLFSFIKNAGVPFIIGGPYVQDEPEKNMYNAALVFDNDSNLRGYYAKSHLVPFAEVIPFVEHDFVRKTMERLVGFSNGWTPGNRLRLFDFEASESPEADQPLYTDIAQEEAADLEGAQKAKVRTAIPICFEDAFPDTCG